MTNKTAIKKHYRCHHHQYLFRYNKHDHVMYHCPAWWSWGCKLAVHACVPGYDLLQMVIRPNMPNAHATTALFPHPENSTRAHLGHNLVTSPAQDKPSVIRTKCAIFSNFLGRAQMCKLYTSATFNLLFKECTPRLGIKQISVIMPPVCFCRILCIWYHSRAFCPVPIIFDLELVIMTHYFHVLNFVRLYFAKY